jgi:eukaryotic-like serine/threonine-protein kinase
MAFRRRYRAPLPPDQAPTQVVHEEGVVPPPGPPPPGPPGEPREWWQWLLVAFVVLAIVAGLAAYFATRGNGDKKVVVPKVIGMTQSAAETKLHSLKLNTKANHAFSDKPAGIVFAQAPGAGKQTETGDVVSMTVSKGQQAVTVPNTVSLTEADAVADLTKAGLKADVVQVPSDARAGTVVAQNPRSGTSVDPGSTVRLNVSKGKTQTTTVTTTTQTTATATTHTTTTTQTTTTTPTTTQVTTTTAQASVPDVVGSTLSNAVAQMRGQGLLADSYPVASDQGGGTVVDQSPAAGTSVNQGSIVRLNVSTGTDRPSITVPDVTGATQAGARRALSKTFTVRTVFRSGEQPGIVVGQLPAAGGQAKRWAQVIIYVGR